MTTRSTVKTEDKFITITGDRTSSVTEFYKTNSDGYLTTSGKLNATYQYINDPDNKQWSLAKQFEKAQMTDQYGGTFTIDYDGSWSYSIKDANLYLKHLESGQELKSTFTVVNSNYDIQSVSATIEITIKGADPQYSFNQYVHQITGDNNSNYLLGTGSKDEIQGLDGNDMMFGYGGQDKLSGGQGNDLISGGDQSDQLYGNEGNDILYGNEGVDHLFGGAGNDILDSGGSFLKLSEEVIGGEGSDTLWAKNGLNSHYHGDSKFASSNEAGHDTLFYGFANQGVHVDLEFQTGHTGWFGPTLGIAWNNGFGHAHFISGFEEVIGSAYNDLIAGSSNSDTLKGDDGNDTLQGRGGDDKLYGGAGVDKLHGGQGNDTLDAGGNSGALREEIIGGAGDDTLIVRNGLNSHYHGDIWTPNELRDPGGTDTLDYSNAIYGIQLALDSGHNWGAYDLGIAWNNGFGHAHFVTGFEKIIGSKHNDIISGTSKDETFIGGLGKDTLNGGAGKDVFIYQSLNDSESHNHDIIYDFEVGIDKIDLRAVIPDNLFGSKSDKAHIERMVQFKKIGDTTQVSIDDYYFSIEVNSNQMVTIDDILY